MASSVAQENSEVSRNQKLVARNENHGSRAQLNTRAPPAFGSLSWLLWRAVPSSELSWV